MMAKKNRILLEMVVVLLVFALSSAVIVQVFAASAKESERSCATTEAMLLAEEVLERLKTDPADPETQLLQLGFYRTPSGIYQKEFDRDWNPAPACPRYALRVTVNGVSTGAGSLLEIETDGILYGEQEESLLRFETSVYRPGVTV